MQESSLVDTPLPPTFRRLVARRTGPSFSAVAEVEEAPMLAPGEGEVLVKVAYAGINGGCETFRARGDFAFARNRTAPLFTLGAEGAGVVVAVGAGVAHLSPGQSVTFVGGAFSEFAVAKAAMCWPVPAPTPASVALTISGTVAAASLSHVARMQPGETVLVTAAGGATGSFAVQLAKLAGCHVVATCGGARKAARLAALGLDRVIDHTREDVGRVLKEEYGGRIDVAYEGVGGPLQAAAWEALAPGGRMLVVGYISEYPHAAGPREEAAVPGSATALPPSHELFWGGLTVEAGGRTAYGNVWPSERADTLAAKAELFRLHDEGRVQAWVDTERQFEGVGSIPEAVDYMLTGQAVGKVVVKVA